MKLKYAPPKHHIKAAEEAIKPYLTILCREEIPQEEIEEIAHTMARNATWAIYKERDKMWTLEPADYWPPQK